MPKILFQACSRESSLSSTPQIEPVRSKNKKSKTVEKHSPIIEDIGCADDDFELTTKSKAHKKVKVNPKEAYGGNILKPRWVQIFCNVMAKLLKSHDQNSFLARVKTGRSGTWSLVECPCSKSFLGHIGTGILCGGLIWG